MKRIALLPFCIMVMTLCACNESERQLERLVDKVYDRLSLEERAAQLYGIYPGDLLVDGKVSVEKCREILPFGVGHICQPTSSQDKDADQMRHAFGNILTHFLTSDHKGNRLTGGAGRAVPARCGVTYISVSALTA